MLGVFARAVLLSFTRRFFVFLACGASSKKTLPPEIPVAAGPRGSPPPAAIGLFAFFLIG